MSAAVVSYMLVNVTEHDQPFVSDIKESEKRRVGL
jgi:hypothetical protein